MSKRLLSLVLCLCMVLSMLPTITLAAEEELLAQLDASSPGGSVGKEEDLVVAAPEIPMPDPQPAAGSLRSGLRDVTLETVSGRDFFYLNGNFAVIKQDTDGETYIYDETGAVKLVEQAATNDVVCGGSNNNMQGESSNTNVVMESGTLQAIYGGDMYSNRIGNTYVEVKGGTLTSLYGGSAGYADQNFGQLIGNVHVVLSGGTVGYVVGGGNTAGTSVSGTVTIEVKNGANVVTQLAGGSQAGAVGDVFITVEEGATGRTLLGGGILNTSTTGDVTIDFSGAFAGIFGGSGSGTTQDVTISFNKGGRITDLLWGGGDAEVSSTGSVFMRLNGGCAYNDDFKGYIYGGGRNGTVTGDVTISIDDYNSIGWHYIRGGGMDSTAVVKGDVSVLVNSGYHGSITCGGYDGVVQGDATLTVSTGKNEATALSYMNGSGSNAAVAGTSTLILENTSNMAEGWISNFGSTVLRNAELSFSYSDVQLAIADLSMDASSVLALKNKSLAVGGNFSGGGTLAITAGNTFTVAGSTTGQTKLRLVPQEGAALPAQALLVSGTNTAMGHYVLTELEDMVLVQKADGLYAMKADAVLLSAALSGTKIYGDTTGVTVTAEAGKGLTTNADVTISLKKDTSSEVVYTETVKLGTDNMAVFSNLPILTAGNYTLTVVLVEGTKIGSVASNFTIGKRTLTMQPESYEAFSRPYQLNDTEVAVPVSHFKNAILNGYYGNDRGAVIDLAAWCFYKVNTPDTGDNKGNTPQSAYVPLRSDVGTTVEERLNTLFIYNNYQLQSPAMTIHITPSVVTSVRFPDVQAAVTVGKPISSCALTIPVESPGSFVWETPNTPVALGKQSYNMIYTPVDTQNYDYSAVPGWNGDTRTITQPLEVRGAQEEPVVLSPYTPTYTVSDTAQIKEIALSDAFPMPGDAGELQMAYNAAASQLGPLTGVSVADGKLQFVIPANAANATAKIVITISSDLYQDTTAIVNITLTSKQAVTISGISIIGVNSEGRLVYRGEGAVYMGTPVITGGYTGELEYIWSVGGQVLHQAPSDVGTYKLTVRVPDSDPTHAGKFELELPIVRAPLSVKANNQTITVGSDVPAYTVTITGLKGTDAATATARCSYQRDSPVGTYPIIPSAAGFTVGKSGNYLITPENGTLTAIPRASDNTGGGGTTTPPAGETVTNPDGSTTTTVTDNTTGTVTETTKNPDGSGRQVITTEAKQADGSTVKTKTTITTDTKGKTTSATATVATDSGKGAVTVPAKVIEALAKTENATLGIETPSAVLTLDGAALKTLATKGSKTPVVRIAPVTADKLPQAAQEKLKDTAVFSLSVNGGGMDFGGGTVTVTLDYTRKSSSTRIVVYYVDDKGEMTKIPSSSYQNGKVTFTTGHFSFYAIREEAMPFTDVDMDSYYADAVLWAVDKGVTSGATGATFVPDSVCTRAQAVTFLWRAMGSPASVTANNPFTDVSEDAYYYNAVLWAVETGITGGTSATAFSPDAVCTRAQVATFLWGAEGSPVVNFAMSFTDVASDAYYAQAVRWAVSEGVTGGTSAAAFSPDITCTRAQIVTFLYRSFAE